MGKHLVLVGGGHAHLTTLQNLKKLTGRGHRVTLVSSSPFHDYSGMGPGLLSGQYSLHELRFNIFRMAVNGGAEFIEASATRLDPDKKELHLSNGSALAYDVISFNTGSHVTLEIPQSALGQTVFPVKPIANLFQAREKILSHKKTPGERLTLLVVGGGPAGCEIVGNLQELIKKENIQADIVVAAGSQLLDKQSQAFRNRTRLLLAQEPLQLLEGVRVTTLGKNEAKLDDGRHIEFDYAFIASGITASAPVPADGLIVNSFLQSPKFPELFGGGDCISFEKQPLDKVGVYAVRQNPILYHNLLASLENRKFKAFIPQKNYLLILNLGLNRAIALRNKMIWSGGFVKLLKSFIDRKFVKKFQLG